MARKPSKRPPAHPQTVKTDAASLFLFMHAIRQAASVRQLDRYRSRFPTLEALREAEPPEMPEMVASFGPLIEEATAQCAAFIEFLDSGAMKVLGKPVWIELRRRVADMRNPQLALIALWVKDPALGYLPTLKDNVRRALDGFAESVEWLERLPEALDDAEASRRVFDAAANGDIRAAGVGTTEPASTGPPFHLTTDMRATSDPLWQSLNEIRQSLISESGPVLGVWVSLFDRTRSLAHRCGLRPTLGEVEQIAATPDEVNAGSPSLLGDCGRVPKNALVLIAAGEDGWIELHDLASGFSDPDKRAKAICWAESWMNARERQLVGPAAASASPALLEQAAERGAAKAVEILGANVGKQAPPAKLPELDARDTEAWQASLVPGMTQAKIADALNRKYPGEHWTQPRVSEAIKRAKVHAEASGLAAVAAKALPQVGSRAPARTFDPAAAEQGRRTDGKARYLRERERQKAKDGDDEE